MQKIFWASTSISSFVLSFLFFWSAVPFSYNSTILFFLVSSFLPSFALLFLLFLPPVYSGFILGLKVHSTISFFASSSLAFWISYILFLSCNKIFSMYCIWGSLSSLSVVFLSRSLSSFSSGASFLIVIILSWYFSKYFFVSSFILGLKSNCLLSCIKVFISLVGFLLFL